MSTMRDLGGPLDCPYKPGTPEHAGWMRTWTDRERRARALTGQMAEDSDTMRAAADADFVAAGYGRPDPVDEILGHDRRRPPRSNHWVPVTVEIFVAASQAAETFEKLRATMAKAFDDSDFKRFFEIAARESGPRRGSPSGMAPSARGRARVGDRRRHGAAATCPVHGPTKGGICRRCAR